MIFENDTSYVINFILNGFVHITLLFTFLTILYYYIISPLSQKSIRYTLSNLIDDIFNHNFPNKISISLKDLNYNSQIQNDLINSNLSFEKYNESDINNNYINNSDIKNNYINDSDIKNNYLNDPGIKNIILNKTKLDISNILNKEILNYISKNKYVVNNLIQEFSIPDNIITIHNENIIFYAIVISLSLWVLSILLLISLRYVFPEYVNISEILIENIITFTIIGVIEYWFFTEYVFKYIPTSASTMINLSINI